ncbi:MAG TPA: hypothetical protein DEQ14_01430 [Treponema sp.]|nr:hypothetical protein [Treponema sp.]
MGVQILPGENCFVFVLFHRDQFSQKLISIKRIWAHFFPVIHFLLGSFPLENSSHELPQIDFRDSHMTIIAWSLAVPNSEAIRLCRMAGG